jgi:hypothetical protein
LKTAYESPIYRIRTYYKGIKAYNYSTEMLGKDEEAYRAGFHFFSKLEDAKKYCGLFTFEVTDRKLVIVKIKAENITYIGMQDDMEVGVAQEITLLEEIE